MARRVRQFASGLGKRGFRKGDVLAIYCPNMPDYALAFLGVAAAGGASATINPLYTADELVHQLNDSGAKYLLTVPALVEKAKESLGKSRVEQIFVIGYAQGATPFEDLLDANPRALSFRTTKSPTRPACHPSFWRWPNIPWPISSI
jgi:acyl-CoA synthetase (AMP-forming)/AMP-acid ligase II